MSSEHDLDAHLMLRTDEAGIEGTLCVGPKAPPNQITAHTLMVYLESRGVAVRLVDQSAVAELVQLFTDNPGSEQAMTVARGKPPRHGAPQVLAWNDQINEQIKEIDARSENLVEENSAPPVQEQQEQDSDDATNHYAHSAFIIVEQDEAIGTITPPDPGEDGEDIYGEIIPAKKSPAPASIDHGTIELADNNAVVAKVRGRLRYGASNQTIERTLNIDGDVGFATGHIKFPGPVKVTGGVKDRFQIDSEGNTTISKLIEAATLRSQRDIIIERGVAGRELASIHARRHIDAGYLESCTVRSGGDCFVKREITNCDVEARGSIQVGNGAIRGGTIAAASRIEVGALGSAQEVRTVIRAGSLPELDGLLSRIAAFLRDTNAELNTKSLDLDTLKVSTETVTPVIAEKLMALEFEITEIRRRTNALQAAADRIGKNIREQTESVVFVAQKVCGGVEIHLRGHQLNFKDEASGPFELSLDKDLNPVYIKGDSPKPASEIAEVSPSSLVPALPSLPAENPEPTDQTPLTDDEAPFETAGTGDHAEAA
ncbi:MAG: DUF342 domain-containing protein [Phycisphaerales bacterium]